MWIDVKIPYEPDNRLADAYNRAMATSQAEWVLLLDHDVMLSLNPLWYDVCLRVIEELKDRRVGLITCRETPVDSIEQCIQHAYEAYRTHGTRTWQIKEAEVVAGYFMLVNKQVWQIVQFRDMDRGVNKVDHDFATRLIEAGYELHMIEGLWVYHHRRVRKTRKRWKRQNV